MLLKKNFVLAAVSLSFLSAALMVASQAHAQVTPDASLPSPQLAPEGLEAIQLDTVREALSGLWLQGLNPESYWTPEFEAAYNVGQTSSFAPAILKSYLKALKDVTTGTVNPENLGNDIIFKKKAFLKPEELRLAVATAGGNASSVIHLLVSQFPQYRALQEAMRRLYPASLDGSWAALPDLKVTLKLGVKDPSVILLKNRLAQYGYAVTDRGDIFDKETQNFVVDVQTQLKFKPDGFISPGGKTWAYVAASATVRMAQVQADMEKMRWIQSNPEDRYVFVNTAFTTFNLTDRTSGKLESINFRTINGRAERKTPSMKDKITHLIFNPFWTVPPTVFIQDKVEILKKLNYWGVQEYFDKNNFMVVNENDREMDPGDIDWGHIRSSNVNFYIKQLPNYLNALGQVKFMMANPYAIYLHDTNERDRFVEDNRLLSSGCIRLEYPLDFAEYLLRGTDWDRYRIEDFVVKPGEILNKETQVNLKQSVPVYILSLTSQVTSDGILRFTDDVYGHNAKMLKTLKVIGN